MAAEPVCFTDPADVPERILDCEALIAKTQGMGVTEFEAGTHLIALYIKQGDLDAASRWDAQLAVSLKQREFPPELTFNYLRRSGILAYRQGKYPAALGQFTRAYESAQSPQQLSISLSDLGTAHMAMGQFADAISAFEQSLAGKKRLLLDEAQNEAQKTGQNVSIAVTLNNLGNVYLKMADWPRAEAYFLQAAELYQQAGQLDRMAHTQENIARVLSHQSKHQQAAEVLQRSLSYFESVADKTAMLRVLLLQADGQFSLGQTQLAAQIIEKANQMETEVGQTAQSILLNLAMGRLLSLQGQFQQSDAMLTSGLNRALESADPLVTSRFYDALVDNAERYQRWQLANQYLKAKFTYDGEEHQKQYDQTLAEIRTKFEYEQQQQALDMLQKDNQISALQISRRNFQLGLLLGGLVLLMLVAAVVIRRLHQARLAERQVMQTQVDVHRARVAELGVSLESLRGAFGKLNQAMLVADNKDRIIFANQASLNLLGYRGSETDNMQLDVLIPRGNDNFWASLSDGAEFENLLIRDVQVNTASGPIQCQLEVSSIASGEPITVIHLMRAGEQPASHQAALLSETEFHQLLVDLMIYSVDAWEQSSRQSRIELAEQSGIWRVSIDEGRLRTRSLDRYLSIRTLPRNPRWREVLRTGHYVLAECGLGDERAAELSAKLEKVNQHLYARALL
ncbi:tetratricopeptide repeat protein [Shewanella khirikhana]|nr:tetratricopeptide repeat protein [Shewanella khirikhana]